MCILEPSLPIPSGDDCGFTGISGKPGHHLGNASFALNFPLFLFRVGPGQLNHGHNKVINFTVEQHTENLSLAYLDNIHLLDEMNSQVNGDR